jgi:signal transduction histidine kinase
VDRNLNLLALTGELDLDRVLERILRSARTAARARYGALGIPDGEGGFARFLTVGISERRADKIGTLPRVHGVLGALLDEGRPMLFSDIRKHPRFGYYPEHHPIMRDFLGVPITSASRVLGNLFLSGSKAGAFTPQDQQEVETLAAYAGVAIANARLYGQAQELAVLEERNRVARELHDSVTQSLFSTMYEAQAAAITTTEPGARTALERIEKRTAEALQEMRALIHALRPKSLERDGLESTLRDHVEALRRAHGARIDLIISGGRQLPLDHELAVFRIAQEALHNALRHAPGSRVGVRLDHLPSGLRLEVSDDGPGFDPERLPGTIRTLGLATMQERAAAVSARFLIESERGRGTSIKLSVPRVRRG